MRRTGEGRSEKGASVFRTRALWIAVVSVLIVGAVAVWAIATSPKRFDASGVLFGYHRCMGIRLDSGAVYPLSNWPAGANADTVDGEVVVKDQASGQILLREGDRVSIKGHTVHAEGDTPCDDTEVITVETFDLLERPTEDHNMPVSRIMRASRPEAPVAGD
jgi:hypothetical protein